MKSNLLWITKTILGAISVLFGLFSAIFYYWGTLQDERHESTKAWFKEKWETVSYSTWLLLPEKATVWLLEMIDALSEQPLKLIRKEWFIMASTPLLFLMLFIGGWIQAGFFRSFLVTSISMIVAIGLAVPSYIRRKPPSFLAQLCFGALGILTFAIWLYLLEKIDLMYAALFMIIFFPFWGSLLLGFQRLILDKAFFTWRNEIIRTNIGMPFGFALTFIGFLIGHLIDPLAYVPQTRQMLYSNTLFDLLTIAVTFRIFSKALTKSSSFRLPMAIFFDLLVAAVLACCSLYFGLRGTDKALGVKELFYVLFARSPDGSQFELSPYFWTMHTTFLPIFLYLLFILFCWASKAFLIPARWFFGKGKEFKNPLDLTSGLCALIMAILAVLLFIVATMQEYTERV